MFNKQSWILIIDNEVALCELIRESLAEQNYACHIVYNAKAAVDILSRQVFDLALIGKSQPGTSGLELLKQIRALYPDMPVIMLAAANDITTAIESMKIGAQDCLTLPLKPGRLFQAVQTALSKRELSEAPENSDLALKEIEAIALGVETRQDMLDIHSEKVILQTASLARQLGLNEETIQQWIVARNQEKSQKIKQVTNMLFKLD